MTTATRKILVTNALPYANGPIHIGHMLGYIQADIWVRFQKCVATSAITCVPTTPTAPLLCLKLSN